MSKFDKFVPLTDENYKEVRTQAENITINKEQLPPLLNPTQVDRAVRNDASAGERISVDEENLTPGMREGILEPLREAIRLSDALIEKCMRETEARARMADDCAEKIRTGGIRELENQLNDDLDSIDQEEADNSELKLQMEREARASQEVQQYRKLANGRNPKTFPFWIYAVLLAMIGVLEFSINISAFRQQLAPLFAVGLALIVGVSFAFSSHYIGSAVKASLGLRNVKFETYGHRKVFWDFIFGFALFGLAFALVMWFRYDLIAEQFGSSLSSDVLQSIGLSGEGSQTIILRKLAEISIANIVAWLLGVAISWTIHDSYPRYPIASKEVAKASKKIENLRRRFAEKRVTVKKEAQILKDEALVFAAAQEGMSVDLANVLIALKEEKEVRQQSVRSDAQKFVQAYLSTLTDKFPNSNFEKNGKPLTMTAFKKLKPKYGI